jgi:cytochrome c oxidase subunit I+III
VVSAVLMVLSAAAMTLARARLARHSGQALLRLLVALGMVCAAASVGIDVLGHSRAGLDPTAQAWSATVAALLSWQSFNTAVLLVMGGYVLARSASGRLRGNARATLDNSWLMWLGVTAQGLVGTGAVQLIGRWL